ncbi:MAG: hypothetical protein QOG00_1391 [Pyrinomonadaceae bacterium]|nr:hypothetical protein [Pyrinomonadaceae bacterium]
MSQENLEQENRETGNDESHVPEQGNLQLPEVTVNKARKELSFTDPTTGQRATLKVSVIEDDEDEDDEGFPPLTPEAFRDALTRMDALGLTWTADRLPHVKAKDREKEDAFFSDEFSQFQSEYPTLPQEVSIAVSYALTGSALPASEVGGLDVLKKKAEIVKELLISVDYRSEFFFKHALKVPYFASVDWEVVFKLAERNVKDVPGVPYALLTLLFHDPNAETNKHLTSTVAMDAVLVNRMIGIFTEIKSALENARDLSEMFHNREKEDEGNAPIEQKQLEQG